MRDESHLDDMRAAIRGDFERLEQRRGEQELMRPVDRRPAPDAPETAEEPDTPAPREQAIAATPVAELEPAVERVEEAELEHPHAESDAGGKEESDHEESEHDDEDDEPRRRSWLDRLLGRT